MTQRCEHRGYDFTASIIEEPPVVTTAIPDARRVSATSTRPPQGIRTEIQALRALAVLGVLVFHLWPLRLQGGYVGVDVFFVVSGFLITDHLMREHAHRGHVSLAAFWARRARRLLPASLLVLAASAIAVYLLVPLSRWAQFGAEIVSSAFYVENWALAAQSVDYMALSNVRSPVQHFWTLGVEEQFYVLWPLLLVVGAVAAGRLGRSAVHGMTIAIALATAASFVFSVVYTAFAPTVAYFSTATRAWEFGAGALLALALRRSPSPLAGAAAPAASWLGFAMIAASMLVYSSRTPFPSYTALLPVVGTLLVIIAGSPTRRWAPTRAFSARPVQFLGDVSYGVYLWHWPLIVLIPYATLAPLNTWQLIAIGFVSVALGWASKTFVEDPLRQNRWLAKGRPRRSLLAAAGAMACVTALSLPLALSSVPPPPAVPDTLPACWGAAAWDAACGGPVATALRAPAESFAADLPRGEVRACEVSVETATFRRCDHVASTAERSVALVGDSHATRWVEAFERAAADEGWGLTTYLVSGCPLVSLEPIGGPWGFDPIGSQLCPKSTSGVLADITSDPAITDVVFTNRTRLYVTGDASLHPLTSTAVADTIRTLQEAGKRVIVLTDNPEMRAVPQPGGGGAPDCLSVREAHECVLPRAEATFDDPMLSAARESGAAVMDLTDQFCDANRCYQQIGGLAVYTDDNHLARSFSASLAPAVAAGIAQAGAP